MAEASICDFIRSPNGLDRSPIALGHKQTISSARFALTAVNVMRAPWQNHAIVPSMDVGIGTIVVALIEPV